MTRALGWLVALLALAPISAREVVIPTGYGGSDTQRAWVLRRHLARGEHAQARDLLARLHARGRKAGDFRTAFERAVSRVPASGAVLEQLEALAQAYPKDPLPRLARGILAIHYAWEARGSGYANQVTKQGWAGFKERIAWADRDLDLALAADPTLAHAHATKIIVARAQGKSEDVIRAHLARALEHDPGCYEAYRRAGAVHPPAAEAAARLLREHPELGGR
ncbi:MAG: DUF4034 domain-containing protein [Planctomycetota bacterium]